MPKPVNSSYLGSRRSSIDSIFEQNASLDRPAVDSTTQVLRDVHHIVNCRSIKRSVSCKNAADLWLWGQC